MRYWLMFLMALATAQVFAQDDRGALATAVEGKIWRVKGVEKRAVEAFERLDAGDVLSLDKDARLTLVFFLTGQQESYVGGGQLEIGPGEGRPMGLAAPVVKKLPDYLVKQIARTPVLLAQGRGGGVRLRAIATPEAIAKVEDTYKRMRMESAANDLNPDMYRLSALFEMKAFDVLEGALADLEALRPGNNEAKVLAALYRKAIKNAGR